MIRKLLTAIARLLPKRTIYRDKDGGVYLERYYLFGDASGLKYFPSFRSDEPGAESNEIRWWQRLLTWLPCVYLHRFAASDSDLDDLHNHPWCATSLILAGGYSEERRIATFDGFEVVRREYGPWSINRLEADTFHRVDLIEDDCWSAIAIGEKTQSWGFWNRYSGEFLHWKEHLRRRDMRVNILSGSDE